MYLSQPLPPLLEDWLFFALCIIIVLYLSLPPQLLWKYIPMAMADLQKLVDNLNRANQITQRAAADASKHSAIMDNFEKRLSLNDENMNKIAEYQKMMDAMDTIGSNGGPALNATFSGHPTASSSAHGNVNFDPATGRQL